VCGTQIKKPWSLEVGGLMPKEEKARKKAEKE